MSETAARTAALLESFFGHPAARHPHIGTAGYSLPARDELFIYRADDPAEAEQVALRHRIVLQPGKSGNVLAVHPDLRAPKLKVRFLDKDGLCVLGPEAAINGTLQIGRECLACFSGGPRTDELAVSANLFGTGHRLFVGRGVTSLGTQIAIKGDPTAVIIGDDCMFSWGIWLRPSDMHLIFDCERLEVINPTEDIVVGPHVWVGQGVLVLKGAEVQAGAIIGAGSVLTRKTYAAFSAHAGNPARKLRDDVTWDRDGFWSEKATQRVREVLGRYRARPAVETPSACGCFPAADELTGELEELLGRDAAIDRPRLRRLVFLLSQKMDVAARLALVQTMRRLAQLQGDDLRWIGEHAWHGQARKLCDLLLKTDEALAFEELGNAALWGDGGLAKDPAFAQRAIVEAIRLRGGQTTVLARYVRATAGFLELINEGPSVEREVRAMELVESLRPLTGEAGWLGNRAAFFAARSALVAQKPDLAIPLFAQALDSRTPPPRAGAFLVELIAGPQRLCEPSGRMFKALFDNNVVTSCQGIRILAAGLVRKPVRDGFARLAGLMEDRGLDNRKPKVDPGALAHLKRLDTWIAAIDSGSWGATTVAADALLADRELTQRMRSLVLADQARQRLAMLSQRGWRRWLMRSSDRQREAATRRFEALDLACQALDASADPSACRVLEACFLGVDDAALEQARRVAGIGSGSWIDGLTGSELPLLEALVAANGDPLLGQLAKARLAKILGSSSASAGTVQKVLDTRRAGRLLTELEPEAALGPLIARTRASTGMRIVAPREQHGPNGRYVWLDRPESDEVMVCFACVYSHAGFGALDVIEKNTTCNVLFVNNPEMNWYSGAERERVDSLIREHVLERFPASKRTYFYGSMGGYGALLYGQRHGARVVTFNPQIDLNLWGWLRPVQRQKLLDLPDRIHLQQAADDQIARAPLYLATGTWPGDMEAFELVADMVTRAPRADFVLEKFDDPEHAGLLGHRYGDRMMSVVAGASRWLGRLHAEVAPPPWLFPVTDEAAFWSHVRGQKAGRYQICRRDGRLSAAIYVGDLDAPEGDLTLTAPPGV